MGKIDFSFRIPYSYLITYSYVFLEFRFSGTRYAPLCLFFSEFCSLILVFFFWFPDIHIHSVIMTQMTQTTQMTLQARLIMMVYVGLRGQGVTVTETRTRFFSSRAAGRRSIHPAQLL
jgi:hypothetical protein